MDVIAQFEHQSVPDFLQLCFHWRRSFGHITKYDFPRLFLEKLELAQAVKDVVVHVDGGHGNIAAPASNDDFVAPPGNGRKQHKTPPAACARRWPFDPAIHRAVTDKGGDLLQQTGPNNFTLLALGNRLAIWINDLGHAIKWPTMVALCLFTPGCQDRFLAVAVPGKEFCPGKNLFELLKLPRVNVLGAQQYQLDFRRLWQIPLPDQITKQIQRGRIRLKDADVPGPQPLQVSRHAPAGQIIRREGQLTMKRVILAEVGLRADETAAQNTAALPQFPTGPRPAGLHESTLDLSSVPPLIEAEWYSRRAASRHVTATLFSCREGRQMIPECVFGRERQVLEIPQRTKVVGPHAGFAVQFPITF